MLHLGTTQALSFREKALKGAGWVLPVIGFIFLIFYYYVMVFKVFGPCSINDPSVADGSWMFYCPSATISKYIVIIFHALIGLTGWSFVAAMIKDPGTIPSNFDPADSNYPVCHDCGVTQPQRAYHCKVCQRCVTRRDHHSIWLGTCIGHNNLKFVILFLFYGALLSAFVALSALYAIFSFAGSTSTASKMVGWTLLTYMFVLFVVWLMATVAGIMCGGLFAACFWLALTNSTSFEAKDRAKRFGWWRVLTKNVGNNYKTSYREALEAVFGKRWVLLPVAPRNGDGTQWRLSAV